MHVGRKEDQGKFAMCWFFVWSWSDPCCSCSRTAKCVRRQWVRFLLVSLWSLVDVYFGNIFIFSQLQRNRHRSESACVGYLRIFFVLFLVIINYHSSCRTIYIYLLRRFLPPYHTDSAFSHLHYLLMRRALPARVLHMFLQIIHRYFFFLQTDRPLCMYTWCAAGCVCSWRLC